MFEHSIPDKGKNPPFVLLAHHRSGSNFLADVIQAHPAAECLSEPLSMHTSAFLPRDLIRWGRRDFDAETLHRDLARLPEAVRFVKDLSAYTTSAPAGTARGFKETLGHEKLRWFAEVFPRMRVVHLVRDPRAVVRAVVSRNMERLWDYGGTLTRYRERHGRELPFPIHTETPVDRVISSWQVRLWEARMSLGYFRATQVRFEDILTEPEKTLARVMRVVGLPVHPAQHEFITASHSGPSRGGAYSTVRDPNRVLTAWKRELPADVVRTIETRLSTEMERLNYA